MVPHNIFFPLSICKISNIAWEVIFMSAPISFFLDTVQDFHLWNGVASLTWAAEMQTLVINLGAAQYTVNNIANHRVL